MTVVNDVSSKTAEPRELDISAPDVSVIIAAYNSALFIEKAINSALNQVDVTVEVIVVDDASSDNTADVVAAATDSRVVLLRHTTNQFAGSARNTGIAQARGKWIAILDSDDEFEIDRLKKLMDLAQRTNSQLVCDNLLICDQVKNTARPMFSAQRLKAVASLSLANYIQGNLGGEQGYALGYFKPFVERKFLEQHSIKYPSNMNLGEDYFFIADLLAAGARCSVDPNSNYRYTLRDGSMSHRMTIFDTENILREGKAFEQRYEFNTETLNALQQRRSYVERNHAFIKAVDAFKSRSVITFLRVIVKTPSAVVPLFRSALGIR